MALPQDTADKISKQALQSLQTRLRLTRASMVAERLLRSFWQVVSWSLLVLAVVRVGLLTDAGPIVLMLILGVSAICWAYLLFRGIREFRWPSAAEAVSRLDQTLVGRPLQTLGDQQAIGADDPESKYLWARHIQRMATAASKSKAAKPDLRLAKRDPWAFRLMAIFLCASALIFARVDPVQSLVNGLRPSGDMLASGPSFEGWAEPPAYTGKPAIYLNKIENGSLLNLPQGTLVTLRIYGDSQAAKLLETVSQDGNTQLPRNETDLTEVSFEIAKSGEITITPATGATSNWPVTVIPDQPPSVTLTGEVTRTLQGALKMPFHATDDYAVAGGTVTIALQLDQVDRRYGLALDPEERPTVTFDLPMPFNRSTDDFTETVIEDLAEHPWAGLPVKITLQVRDEAKQTGAIDPLTVPMPGKRFFDTLAAAVAEQRRDLLWNRDNATRISMILRAITYQPDTIFDDEKAYLIIRTALRRLDYNRENGLSDEIRDDVADLLWQAALLIEDGDLSDARERLKWAQERLSEAMKNGATDEEIAELMEELRKATKQYMHQLAREQRDKQNNQVGENQQQQQITQDQIQQMMDRIQELMEQGRMDEAQELMRQLQQMLENLQVTENGQGGEGDPGESDMENLRDTLRQQQDLADETFRQRQEEFNEARRRQSERQQQGQEQPGDRPGPEQGDQRPGEQQGQNQGESPNGEQQRQGQGPGQGDQLGDLADRQQALRDLLSQRRGQLSTEGDVEGEAIGRSLQEAEREMGEAEQNLAEGNTEGALDNQANAMEALREGMRQLNEANRQANGQGNQGQGQQGVRSSGQRRDPLGREVQQSGAAEADGTIPSEDLYRRSRELMDEIRKRSGDRTRPELELDYLDRLLDRF